MRRAPLRLAGASAAWGLLALGSTLTAMNLAARPAGPQPVPLQARLRGFDPYLDPSGLLRFARVSPQILADLLGSRGVDLLLGAAPPSPTTSGEATPRPGPRASAADSPAASPPQPPPATAAPVPLPDLQVAMAADRPAARAGEDVVYTITVRNAGGASYRGSVRVDSHIPSGTTFRNYEPPPCPGPVAVDPANPGGSCAYVPVPVPGQGEALHQVGGGQEVDDLPPGGELAVRFRVTINPDVPAGTELINHAHLIVPGRPDATTPVVVVRVQ